MYWVEIPPQPKHSDGLLLIRNLHNVGKTPVKLVEKTIESDLLYPLLRGRDVNRWRSDPSCHILLAQDPKKRIGYDESWMKQQLPNTYWYLKQFETDLRTKRQSQSVKDLIARGAFYSMYAVGEYTLAPYKVCWREQAEFLTCAVVDGAKLAGKNKVVIPDHKLMFVPLADKCEAHYLCAMLNCGTTVLVVKSYGIETQTSTHLLEHVRIPQFDSKDKRHQQLTALSVEAHGVATEVTEESAKRLQKVEAEIDSLAAEVWGMSDGELRDIQSSLADLR